MTAHSTKSTSKKKWSAGVTENSDALDLKETSPYRSAMSMLTFYINRAGKNLDDSQKEVLEKSKDKLRIAFGREPKKKD
jgi:hypothetical protein